MIGRAAMMPQVGDAPSIGYSGRRLPALEFLMMRRLRSAPPYLFAAALAPMLALAACAPAPEETFEEELPAAGAADADTGAGSAIETEFGNTSGAAAPGAEPEATPCDTEALQSLIGEQGSEAVYARATQESGASSYRALGPSDMATMDFRPDRLNIDLDADGRITGFRCG
ncbi:Elastase inhibitor AFLEI Flags: Precursor [Luteimonas sp. 100069]|nr:Elastase inhibitor AFLEI Flags: Precursor [Luteimonas sp. 100069]